MLSADYLTNTELIGTVIRALMTENAELVTQPAGRPRDEQVTAALLDATLVELSLNGLEKTTVAAISNRARTSKQAVYRRYPAKLELIAAAIEHALVAVNLAPPQRGSVAADLRQCLTGLVNAFQETPLGGVIQVLVSSQRGPQLEKLLSDVEEGQRLVLRQIFIATPFETDMETRIDLLLGLVYFRLLVRGQRLTKTDVETAIYLVLGLVAPRDPAPNIGPVAGLPGI